MQCSNPFKILPRILAMRDHNKRIYIGTCSYILHKIIRAPVNYHPWVVVFEEPARDILANSREFNTLLSNEMPSLRT